MRDQVRTKEYKQASFAPDATTTQMSVLTMAFVRKTTNVTARIQSVTFRATAVLRASMRKLEISFHGCVALTSSFSNIYDITSTAILAQTGLVTTGAHVTTYLVC